MVSRLSLVFLVVLALLAGCAAHPGQTPVPRPLGHRFTYVPSVPVNGGQRITITFWTQVNQQKIYQSLIDAYRQLHPNVVVDLVASSYLDHFKKLQTALGSGIGPDLFHMHNEYGEALRPSMASYPPDLFPLDQLEADFVQVDTHLSGGRLYFIDTGLMTSSIYYDKQVWKAAGLTNADVPRTWDDLRTLARKLTQFDAGGRMTRAGFNPNGIGSQLLLALNLQQGQRLFDPRDPSRPLVDTPASRRSLEFLHSLYSGRPVTSVSLPPFHESLGAKKAAMIYAWGWANGWLKENFPDLDFGTFPIPTWDGRTPPAYDRYNGESSMGVNEHSPEAKKRVAFDLIRFFLASDQFLSDFCRSLSLIPTKRNLVDDPSFPGQGLVERTVWPGALPAFYEKTLDDTLVDPFIIDGLPATEVLRQTQDRLDRQFAQSTFRSSEASYRFAGDFVGP